MIFNRDEFVDNWKKSFKDAQLNRSPHSAYWDGSTAIKMLKQRGLLQVAQFNEDVSLGFLGLSDWRTKKAIEEFEGAARAYENLAGNVVKANAELRTKLASIARCADALKKLNSEVTDGRIQNLARPLMNSLDSKRQQLEAEHNRKADQKGHGNLGIWGTHLRGELPVRDRDSDIDSWFQKVLAFLFLMFLQDRDENAPKLSLLTVSRLVVLFYMAGGLCLSLGYWFAAS